MNHGITAILLIRLDARMGAWQRVADLAAHLGVADAAVQLHLEQMRVDGMVSVQRDAGSIVAAMVDPVTVGA